MGGLSPRAVRPPAGPLSLTPRARLLAACRAEPVDRTPVWFMRQAGSALESYRALRDRYGVAGIAHDAELAARASALPVEELGVDGAVLFADIMLLLEPMGVEVELTSSGPRLARPLRSVADIDRLRPVEPAESLSTVLDAVRILRLALGERAAIIGLAGGPFILAAYLIEGGPSRDFPRARAFLHAEPMAFARLLDRLAEAVAAYLTAQLAAGADVVQLFDSWVGVLSADDYRSAVASATRRAIGGLPGPVILFATGAAHLLGELAESGEQVLGVDERIALEDAFAAVGPGRAVQGNLDPARVAAGWGPASQGAGEVLRSAAGRRGHIFNLGHGVPAGADAGVLRDLVTLVHEWPASGAVGQA